jgi:hypothetical protein
MPIQSVVYTNEACKLLGRTYLKKLGAVPYDNSKPLKPNTLLLGVNSEHQIACNLSDLPLVVFDGHTDMYVDLNKGLGMQCGNWIVYALEFRKEVHLYIPDVEESCPWLSKPSEKFMHKLYVYSPTQQGLPIKFENNCSKIVESVRKLHERMKGLDKQISVDVDFRHLLPVEEVAKLILPLAEGENVYDYWLQSYKLDKNILQFCRNRELETLEPLAEAVGLKV